jgi:outer membrane protein OmpA-like peptidoglycan-associated protein
MKKFIILIACFYCYSAFSQSFSLIQKANGLMKEQKFSQAAALWEDIMKTGENANIHFKLGLCYFYNPEQKLSSLPYFKQALSNVKDGYSFDNPKIAHAPADAIFFLAEAFMVNNLPDSALFYFNLYKKKARATSTLPADKRINNCINNLRLKASPLNIVAENLGNSINSPYAETHAVVAINNSLLFFASTRPKAMQENTAAGDNDIYMSVKLPKGTWSKAVVLPFNTTANEHPACITSDGKMLIFARQVNGNYDLYSVSYENGNWSEPQSLGKSINTKADEREASITLDGNYLYFSSNRENEDKTNDIYVSTKKADNTWGKATKLPATINTAGNECAPYIHPEGHTLFFSTDGSDENLGNLDIFYSTKGADNRWSTPKILLCPINTSADDFGFSLTADGKRYATQLTGFNSFDIVEFTGNEKYLDDFGLSTETSKMVSELNVMETLELEKIVEKEVQTTEIVEVQTEIQKPDKKEEADSIKNYSIENLDLEKIDSSKREAIFQKVKDYYTNLFKTDKTILFKTLYFNFNSAELLLLSQNELRLLIEYMNEHTDVKVEVIGHTDILGNWDANLTVSNSRAFSVYQFLVKNKIAHNRIIYYGKGSAAPIASNENENGRSKNRRVEIMLLK